MIKSPLELHPELTNYRIDFIGKLIAETRAEVLEVEDPRDTGWGLGCRAYDWCRETIKAESEDCENQWLKVINPTLKFVFSIGEVEVSFYKGISLKPKKNIYFRAQEFSELRQIPLLELDDVPSKLIWAYAVETDLDGNTTNIEFFGMTESGEIVAARTLPIYSIASKPTSIDSKVETGVDIPPVAISLSKSTSKKKNKEK